MALEAPGLRPSLLLRSGTSRSPEGHQLPPSPVAISIEVGDAALLVQAEDEEDAEEPAEGQQPSPPLGDGQQTCVGWTRPCTARISPPPRLWDSSMAAVSPASALSKGRASGRASKRVAHGSPRGHPAAAAAAAAAAAVAIAGGLAGAASAATKAMSSAVRRASSTSHVRVRLLPARACGTPSSWRSSTGSPVGGPTAVGADALSASISAPTLSRYKSIIACRSPTTCIGADRAREVGLFRAIA